MHRHRHLDNRKMRSRLRSRSHVVSTDDGLLFDHAPLPARPQDGVLAAQPLVTPATMSTMTVYESKPVATALKIGDKNAFVATSTSAPEATQSTISPPLGPPSDGAYIQNSNGISPTSKHLLIAAGSIGGTMLIAFIVFLVWKRKQRAKDKDALSKSKVTYDKEPTVSAPLGSNWGVGYRWENKSGYTVTTTAVGAEADHLPELGPAFLRPGTRESNRAVPTRALFPPPNRQVSGHSPSPSQTMPFAPTPPATLSPFITRSSSPILPIERPLSPARQSSIPPYLAHLAGSPNPTFSPPKISRFSWTNSQVPSQAAPKTPLAPRVSATDTTRFSGVSEAESVTRYRTVESWVGHQAGKYEEVRIQERIRMQIDEAIREVNEAGSMKSGIEGRGPLSPPPGLVERGETPVMPSVPRKFQAVGASKPNVPEKEIGTDDGARAKHVTTGSDVYMVHPGTKVEIPRAKHIPSVILDGTLAPRETYARRDSYGN